MSFALNINSDAVVGFTKTLEEMHRSALPSAIRGTLNKASYDVKTNTLLKSSKASFVNRDPNFFKANSKFEYTKGFNISKMKSTVGMVETNLRGRDNYSVKDLKQQEDGGTIGHRSFIPLPKSRVGQMQTKVVRTQYRLSVINEHIVNVKDVPGNTARAKFVNAMISAGKNGFVLSGKTLWKVNSIKRKGVGFSKTALYNFKEGRSVRINKPTHFMRKATEETAKKMEGYYVDEAKRQINKLKNK